MEKSTKLKSRCQFCSPGIQFRFWSYFIPADSEFMNICTMTLNSFVLFSLLKYNFKTSFYCFLLWIFAIILAKHNLAIAILEPEHYSSFKYSLESKVVHYFKIQQH